LFSGFPSYGKKLNNTACRELIVLADINRSGGKTGKYVILLFYIGKYAQTCLGADLQI
jgi:hypothetical protein